MYQVAWSDKISLDNTLGVSHKSFSHGLPNNPITNVMERHRKGHKHASLVEIELESRSHLANASVYATARGDVFSRHTGSALPNMV